MKDNLGYINYLLSEISLFFILLLYKILSKSVAIKTVGLPEVLITAITFEVVPMGVDTISASFPLLEALLELHFGDFVVSPTEFLQCS